LKLLIQSAAVERESCEVHALLMDVTVFERRLTWTANGKQLDLILAYSKYNPISTPSSRLKERLPYIDAES